MTEITGCCLCGAVTFAATAEKLEVGACHCGMCRRWSGGPLLAIEAGDVRLAGEDNISTYRSSQWAERGFCKTCGTNLFWRLADGGGHYAISAGALDNSDGLTLTQEIYIDDKPAYYDFANDTVKKTGAEFMAAFAKGNE